MKMTTIKRINLICCVLLAASLIVISFIEWGKNGSYNFGSFLTSIIVHGGISVALYNAANFVINKLK